MGDAEEGWPTAGVVAVVGLGKIGLPLAVQYALHGWHVLGCDISAQVVDYINSGQAHIHEEPELESMVPELVKSGLLTATLNTTEAVAQASVVVVIVPVYVDKQHHTNFQVLDAATLAIGRGLQAGTLVIYETTLPVDTTEKRLRTMLEESSHMDAGREFYLAYSPERVSSRSIFRDLRTYPKIVGGIDARSTQRAVSFYRSVLSAQIITMNSSSEAEFVKLIETTYRDVNIALANEFALYADAHHLNVLTAISAANTQPYAHIHQPGVGVGGHCIPIYPYFLMNDTPTSDQWDKQHSAQLLKLPREARQINDSMAEYAVQRIEAVLGSLWRRSVLLLGVTYRGDVRETAFSSAYLLQEALVRHGVTVYANDPLYQPEELRDLGFEPLPPDREQVIEAMILQTAHQSYQTFDFRRFSCCQVLLDGRYGLMRSRVEEAGILYLALGDGATETVERCLA